MESRTPDDRSKPTPSATDPTTALRPARKAAAAALILLAVLAVAPMVAAQDGCRVPDKNQQCTEFGTISMDSQSDVRGESIDLSAKITLDTAYADRASRWLLFSVRNVTDDGTSPVTVTLVRFGTAHGDIVTTRVEHPTANVLNLWVDTLDTPIGTPITLDLRVGSTERGAFRLETLVMAFDRGYVPIQDSAGNDASLFSFTLLGVNEETPGVASDGRSFLEGHKVPGIGTAAILALLVGVTVLLRRREA